MNEKAKLYRAYTADGLGIISVLARNDEDAKEEVERQLNRHGRRGYYQQWVEGGKIVKERIE